MAAYGRASPFLYQMDRPVDENRPPSGPARQPAEAPPTTRFAPSPTGYMHLGHAYSALVGWGAGRASGGRFRLRIEDLDRDRSRPEFERAVYEDLAWLGIEWDEPVRRQSDHLSDYAAALDELRKLGLIYPCFCTRPEVRAEIKRADAAPHDSQVPLYPGACRSLSPQAQRRRIRAVKGYALRLDVAKAAAVAGPLTWTDRKAGTVDADPTAAGDVVLARSDVPTSYHLAVTLDDHLQGVTLVTRGWDLLGATHIQRLLQSLLGLKTPDYHHHPMITDPSGVRLAKRNRAMTLRALRNGGKTPREIYRMVGLDGSRDLPAQRCNPATTSR